MSPDREDYPNNSWLELKTDKEGRNYEYWIGENKNSELEGTHNIITGRKKPNINDGWDAEKLVKRDLEGKGYTVFEVSSGGFGCDLIAEKKGFDKPIFIEVKSSIGKCSPTMTENEWLSAQKEGRYYWLAIVEDLGQRREEGLPIYYVKNPSSLEHKKNNVIRYNIMRKSWISLTNHNDSNLCTDLHHGINMEHIEIIKIIEKISDDINEIQVWVKNTCDECGYITSGIVRKDDFLFNDSYVDEDDECTHLSGPDLLNCEVNGNALIAPCMDCENNMWGLFPENLGW